MWRMANEREIEEVVARCVAIMIAYDRSGRSAPSTIAMIAGIQSVAGRANRFHLEFGTLDVQILQTVKAELLARYSPMTAHTIHAAFLKALALTPAQGKPRRPKGCGAR
jgi:hypothetical protein